MNAQIQAENVRFSRLIITLFLASYALFNHIEGVYLVLLVTLSTILFSSRFSLTTGLLHFLRTLKLTKLFHLNPRYQRSFFITRKVEIVEELLRFFTASMVLGLYYFDFHIASILIAFLMATMMLISSFFGFCMSGLFIIAAKTVLKRDLS